MLLFYGEKNYNSKIKINGISKISFLINNFNKMIKNIIIFL